MSLLGFITMLLCVGGVTAFLAWCIYKVIRNPNASDRMHSQVDIEPPDVHEDN